MSYITSSASVQQRVPSHVGQATPWRLGGGLSACDVEIAPTKFSRREVPGEVQSRGQQTPERWAGLRARIACDRQTSTDAFRLRHLCYASKGYIDVRDNGLFSDEYDAEPDNATVVLYEDEEPIGSVRVCTTTSAQGSQPARELPVTKVFPCEMAKLLPPGARAAEINRLVTHPDHAQSLSLVFILMRMADYLIRRNGPDLVTFCVRDNHVPFYKRLQFQSVAGPKLYTGLKFMTTLMVVSQERFQVVRRNVPVLNLPTGVIGRYDLMWSGAQVSVLGDQ